MIGILRQPVAFESVVVQSGTCASFWVEREGLITQSPNLSILRYEVGVWVVKKCRLKKYVDAIYKILDN